MLEGSRAPRFILASASPRRLDLLRRIGLEPDAVDPAYPDETPRPGEAPRDLARRLARDKARAVAGRHAGAVVLGADTVVACGRRVLPKAEDAAAARRCLEMLSGRRHTVYGGLCVIGADGREHRRLVATRVRFKRLEEGEIARYIAGGEWRGKAGGYAIQGRAAALVPWINGSYSNVVGLPLCEAAALLAACGVRGENP
ncbi:MAG: Maf family protein [Alphaproteobacteria bacterium]